MEQMPQTENLTADMEERIKSDESGELKKELHTRITAQIEAIDAKLKSGLSPEEFRKMNTIKVGLQSALVILERIWLYYHTQK